MSDVQIQEAYLVGCLLARGSIQEDGNSYRLILRVPFRQYSPLGEQIVGALLGKSAGYSFKELVDLKEIRAYGANIVPELIRLKAWHPWRKPMTIHVIRKEGDHWKIEDSRLAKEYLKWQKVYLERELKSIQFVLGHLRNTASSLATDIKLEKRAGDFGVLYNIIEAKIAPVVFEKLREEYNLDVGDVFRHATVPARVFNYPREALEEFVRGLADVIGFFDKAPVWEIHPNSLWQVRFSVVNDNPHQARDICNLLQDKLDIPVFCIDWAATEVFATHKRGGRDHLVEVWAHNFRNFPDRLFYLEYKNIDFRRCLEEDSEVMKKVRKKPFALAFCPRKGRKKDYIAICKAMDCSRLRTQQILSL